MPNTATASATPLPAVLVPRPKPTSRDVAAATIGQSISTTDNKRRELLPDGSTLYLDRNTTVRLTSERELGLEKGRIFVEAVPADREAGRGSFIVKTPQRKLEALGTKFAVDALDPGLLPRLVQIRERSPLLLMVKSLPLRLAHRYFPYHFLRPGPRGHFAQQNLPMRAARG